MCVIRFVVMAKGKKIEDVRSPEWAVILDAQALDTLTVSVFAAVATRDQTDKPYPDWSGSSSSPPSWSTDHQISDGVVASSDARTHRALA